MSYLLEWLSNERYVYFICSLQEIGITDENFVIVTTNRLKIANNQSYGKKFFIKNVRV